LADLTAGAYRVEPLRFVGGLPVFTETDRYVENYQRIAADHVAAMKPGSANPFMEDELWKTLEDSTRALIGKHVAPQSRILDVGVGLGRLLGPAPQYKRFGIDISFDYLKRAREAGIEVAFSRIEDMPFHDCYFDAVVVCDVLEHVLDLDGCMRQVLRVLRPGGILILRVPYREDLSGYLDSAVPYEFIHLRNFDEHGLTLLLGKIYRCEVLELAQVAPYLVGAPRLKLRPLPAASEARRIAGARPLRRTERLRAGLASAWRALWGREEPPDPLRVLRAASQVTEEELVNWIYRLRDEQPGLYRQLAPHLVLGIEINVVARKP